MGDFKNKIFSFIIYLSGYSIERCHLKKSLPGGIDGNDTKIMGFYLWENLEIEVGFETHSSVIGIFNGLLLQNPRKIPRTCLEYWH